MNDDTSLQSVLEYGLTPSAFDALTKAAQVLVDTGDLDEALRTLFNQVNNFSKKAGVDSTEIFRAIVDELGARLYSSE